MKKLAWLSLALLIIFVNVLASCSTGATKMPVDPQNQSKPTVTSSNPAGYLSQVSIDPATAKYFSNVKDALSLNAAELVLLQKNGFAVTDRLAWDRFLDAYAWIYWKDLPVLVTTDSILHSVHQSYDDLLIDIERAILMPKLDMLLSETRGNLLSARSDNAVPEMVPFYEDVSTYLSVATALLKGYSPSGSSASSLYSFAVQSDSVEKISLFGTERAIDFTMFKPRGHYTTSEDLQRYFRSMSWLGQIDFRFVQFDPVNSKPVLSRNQMVSAAILREAVDAAGERETWNEIDQLLQALVGGSDNITLPDFDRFMLDMNLTSPAEVLQADEKNLLAQLLNNDYGNQRITGQLISRDLKNFSTDPIPRPISFMFMGQRFAIDSYVLGNLVYDRMMKDGQPIYRALPSTLDVMYSLGNDRALTHLSGELEKYKYEDQLSAMRSEVDSLPPDYWTAPTYNQWLGMVRTLNQPTTGEKYPQSLRTSAWADKMLQTQLASWTQLRHDNILYVKQSVTTMTACEYPQGYVEPYPEFYGALYDYAKAGQATLSMVSGRYAENDVTYIKERAAKYFQNVMMTATQLKTLAEKELALQDFTADEEKFLKSVVVRKENDNRGCGGPNFVWNGWYVDLFYREDANPALIADVHTNPNPDGPLAPSRVLHAATGMAVPLCLVAETDEGSTMYVGPSFTYYDVIEEGFPPVRLTDEDWRSRLNSGVQPLHPDWVKSFMVTDGQRPGILKIDSGK